MKVTFDLPDSLKCVFLNYVYVKGNDLQMEVISVATDGLYDGSIIERRTNREADQDMTDKELVKRLRIRADGMMDEWDSILCNCSELVTAASRIEQLHTELTKEKIDNTNLIGEIATVAAERDRYKAERDAAERESPQPSTNADRIRAMSDDEMAEFLMECNPVNCQQCAFSFGWRCDPDREDYSDAEKCTEGRKRWLQQPAEEAR